MNDEEQEINEPQKADKSEEQYESPEIMNFIQENKENKTDDDDIRSDHESKQSKKNMNSDEKDDNAPIGLENRQPSFNDLSTGHVIPEGLGEDDIDFETIDQNPAESVLVLTKNEEVNDTIIGLNARQDSVSNFNIISNIETAEKSENETNENPSNYQRQDQFPKQIFLILAETFASISLIVFFIVSYYQARNSKNHKD